jgi:lysophospholipase L1-like esterase
MHFGRTGFLAVLGAVATMSVGVTAVGTAQSAAPSMASASSGITPLRVVGLGDSVMTAEGCPGCRLYLDQYAAALSDALGRPVTVDNLAVPGAEVAQLLTQVLGSADTREAIAAADVVVVTIGINDLPFNRLDDPCHVAPAYPVIEWTALTTTCMDEVTGEFSADLGAVMLEVTALRAGEPTALRLTTVYDSVLGDGVDPSWDSPDAVEPAVYAADSFWRATCDVAATYGAACVDTYHVLNGPDGRTPAGPYLVAADYTHLGQAGHDAFAAALVAAPLS